MAFLETFKIWVRKHQNDRLYRRISADVPVTIQLVGKLETFGGKIKNWSPGGVFIEISPLLPMNLRVDLEFVLDDSGESKLKLRGQVVRQVDQHGVGVMFTDFTESGLTVLREFLTRQLLI